MSYSLPPAESIILNEPSLCNQTITFGEDSIDVNRFILAAHSTYFRSLWFLEFGDRDENPIDFSHLPVDSNNFLAFIKSFFGGSFTLNDNHAYDFYYLVHYFRVDKLIELVENHLNTRLVTWDWLKPFIKEADERNDLRALEFVGPFFSKVDDLVIDDVMAITTEGLQALSKYCTSSQSQSWFIKSMVESILNQSFDLNEFSNVLNSCSIEALSYSQWNEFLFVPLTGVEELETDLMQFLFTKIKNLYFDSLEKENSDLKEENSDLKNQISTLQEDNMKFVTEISGLKCEIEEFRKTTLESIADPQSKVIRFSHTRKYSQFQVSDDKKKVVGAGSDGMKSILGEDPLVQGNVYTWKLRYQGHTSNLAVGVIDESKFSVDGGCHSNAHCFHNGNNVWGCLSGNKTQWNPGELLEISVNLVNHNLTIKSVSNSSINLTGTLPRLSGGNYYPFALLWHSDHVIEIVE
ncbi:hypothetical protein GEMRC1_000001 [Eukaryota sp. GEM-RC1]